MLSGASDPPPFWQKGSRFLPAAILALGLFLSVSGWHLVRGEARRSEQIHFQRYVDLVVATVRSRFESSGEALRGAAAVAKLNPRPTHSIWTVYMQNVSPALQQGLLGIGYIERINRSQIPELEARERAEGRPNFKVEDVVKHSELYVVTQMEPEAVNGAALGAEVGRGNRRRLAAEKARDTGDLVLTTLFPVFSGNKMVPGFLMFLPVYRAGTAPESTTDRRQALQGWVYASLQSDLLMQGVLDEMPVGLDCDVYEGAAAVPDKLIFAADHKLAAGGSDRVTGDYRATVACDIYGQRWTLVISNLDPLNPHGERLPWFVLLGGLIISLLSAALARVLVNVQARAVAGAARMTASLKQQESQFRFIFEGAPVGISWSQGGRAESRLVNAAHVKITGVPVDDSRDPENYIKASHPDDREKQRILLEKLDRGEIDHFSVEKRFVHPGGKIVWAVLTIDVSRDPVTGERQQVATVVDITELKRQADELRAARDMAERANLAKGQFLAVMSHEIRTPMNGVIGMTSLLLGSPLTREQREYAETIRNSGDTLLNLINSILDFSKIESGHLELESETFSLRDCVEGVLDLLAPQFAEKRLDLLYEIADGVPGMVRGDATRLRQILVNLLGNAAKFTEKGEAVLSVRSQMAESGKCELAFSVRDTGIGIPPEAMGRLFRSFSQVDASTTRRFGGTGLGLVISMRLAEMMGGRMWVESEVGQGSAFFFTIMVEALVSKPRLFLATGKGQLDDKRLLIVDDNATSRRILTSFATGWGMSARAAASGAEAIAWLAAGEEFEAAVLDMQMPAMDGGMLAAEIRKQRTAGELPFVLLSSLGRREFVSSPELFAAFLTKPVKPSLLFEALVDLFHVHDVHKVLRHALPDPGKTALRPERVLLAEDNAVNQKVAVTMLAKLGYRADVAANGKEVLDALERQAYDIVLMDVHMPEMDGLEATRHIRGGQKEGSGRPWIIALTANAMQGDRALCLAAGMDDYISKPITLDELIAAMVRALARFSTAGTRAAVGKPGA